MTGRKEFCVYDKHVRYEFSILRKVTVIKGNSGIGKSVMIDMLASSLRSGNTGVNVITNSEYWVFNERDNWIELLESAQGTVFFADEQVDFVMDDRFVSLFNKSDCYLVVVNRARLGRLVYSIDSVVTLVSENGVNRFVAYESS